MRNLGLVSACAFFTLLWTSLLVQKATRRLASWSQLFDPKMHWLPRHPLSARLAIVSVLIALTVLGYAIFLLGRASSAFVWDGTTGWSELIMLYPMLWFCFTILSTAARSLAGHDTALPGLGPDALAQVEADIRQGEYLAAINRVRNSASGTGNGGRARAGGKHRLQARAHRAGHAHRPARGRSFNPRALLLCAAAESLLLFTLWKTVPPSQPLPSIAEFGAQFIFGVCISPWSQSGFCNWDTDVACFAAALPLGADRHFCH